ncbi:MAG TPA: hypothetical protein VN618_12350 [Solirubrobacteraceae bacterium]|nr:hypothetical protein [Solirubrobacteraceae bacterium]
MPYGHSDEEWNETKRELRAVLVAKARDRGVIPYSAVVSQIGPIRFAPDDHSFHHMLDETSTDEDEHGRGLLTVVVVHRNGDMVPGPGFFDLAARRGREVIDIDKTWLDELKTVWRYWRDH